MSLSTSYPALRPSLLLDFANAETLDPRITFARASTARFYDQNTVAKAEENLLLNSGTLSGTGWTASEMTLTLAAGTAPDGTATATKAIPSTNNIAHSIFQSATVAGSNVQSCFVKADGYTKVALRESQTGAYYASFELSGAGTVLDQSSATGAITSVGNGWYRISMVGTITGTTRWSVYVLAAGYTTGAPGAFAGDGTSGVFIWGAQLEQRSAVTAYTATTTAPITRYTPQLMTAAANIARLDHDPITREARGLLIEESRSNLVTFSEDYSNAAWTKDANRGTFNTTTVAPDGTLTARILIAGSGNAGYCYRTVSTTPGTAYTFSVYAKAGSVQFGYVEALGNAICYVNLLTLAVVPVAGLTVTATSVGNGWVRIAATGTASAASHAFAFGASSASGSQTMPAGTEAYFWGAQLEAGAFATSYIARLDATAASRAADAASMTGTSFTSWYRADQGTVVAEASSTPSPTASHGVFGIGGGTSANNIGVYRNPASNAQYQVRASGTTQADFAALVAAQPFKVAVAFATDNVGYALAGTAQATDTSAQVPVVDRLVLGAVYAAADFPLNGHLKKLAFYPARLTNAQLAALTR